MPQHSSSIPRRDFLGRSVFAGAALLGADPLAARASFRTPAAPADKALIAITLDLEMSRHFPTRGTMHWDYEKGNLDADTKAYALEAARRVKAKGGLIHFFAVGRVFEQENVDWLREIVELGHPVGNHTYDHVNLLAQRRQDIQFRFQRAPWLIHGKEIPEVLAENIRMTNLALDTRLGIKPAGFRTPGGFSHGLEGRPDIQTMLLKLGFDWVSSKYVGFQAGEEGESEPAPEVFPAIVAAQTLSQPSVYPTGLVEVPMSPISDVHAMRSRRWNLDHYLEAIRAAVTWAIDNRAVFDYLAHPSCLVVTDPDFRTVEMICDLVKAAGDRAAIVDLGTIAERAKRPHESG
jgi:peptidoglycan/xylan/chitin deacetylase (PgdA/CDA1 family)